jgi:PIN domain nuclease of toxin-antitoxin system
LSDAVLDSSAVLAVILEEPGAERVEALLPGAKVWR